MLVLLYNEASPYSRKVRAYIKKNGLDNLVQMVRINPYQNQEQLQKFNPQGQIPCLVYQDKFGKIKTVSGSEVICKFLNEKFIGLKQPVESTEYEDLYNSIMAGMDAAFRYAVESKKGNDADPNVLATQTKKIQAVLRKCNAELGQQPQIFNNKAGVTLVSLLQYVHFRVGLHLEEGLRHLENWYDNFSQLDFFQQTKPTETVDNAVEFSNVAQVKGLLSMGIWQRPDPLAESPVDRWAIVPVNLS